ncbi:UDP-N-acetylmuramoyl-L-alanine--D-glutamate ligase [Vagococcus humatus]|uniref:UDP-N-acetylmuramoylalanine--D-glutamate ligase n=1 Tax=Vagococcus humatus TaxID=1889241 RepID=A0A3S0AXJ0_9ENTE|nr:UDP-N-acetylmuramoyl-L-alanine--D-glutamate ligase [Vagococcus humatus]RST89464.1 UDP-N-acetylmuramoyl-L-alanine--D-glutamate ligase [Vagococcus humatus]
MKSVTTYENEKVLVLGLAKSGVSAAKLLHQLGAIVTVNDAKKFEDNPEAQELLELGIRVVTGGHPVELLDEDFSLLVKNPGIPYTNPILEKAMEQGVPIMTEVELSYQVSEAPIIGITGTNGKTTTTTMIGKVLNQGEETPKAYLSGNIGIPASEVCQKVSQKDLLVMELSSFQLLGIDSFHPHIAVITNLYEAHLDYHGTREEYVKAKWRIQQNMTEKDYLVINANQEELRELSKQTKATVIPFCTNGWSEQGAYELGGELFYQQEKIMSVSDLGVVGQHNVENALAAIVVAKLNHTANASIKEALSTFTGVPHRTEYLGMSQGRKFYNDSKATNILATEKALSGFDNTKVILLAGGLDRGNSFEELEPSLAGLKGLVVFGETQDKLITAGHHVQLPFMKKVNTMEEAVQVAVDYSQSGDTILLSPACASWDQYPNFEIRGDRFRQAVEKIMKEMSL